MFTFAASKNDKLIAEIAQLVEHNLAKVRVASSSLVFRSNPDNSSGFIVKKPWWWNGRHAGLKIPWTAKSVRVQVPPEVQCIITIVCFSTVVITGISSNKSNNPSQTIP